MSANFYLKAFVLFSSVFMNVVSPVSAQYTETFEIGITGGQTFTSNGLGFTLTNALTVRTAGGTEGYNQSANFIENTAFPGPQIGQTSRITTDGGAIINIKSLFLFVSLDGGETPSTDGSSSVRFVGKLAGVTQFTVIKTTGFVTNFTAPGNGFGFVDFLTEGGQNVANSSIDELEITLQGTFNYLAIDDFSWSMVILPVSLSSFTAALENEKAVINWRTSQEINNSHFTIEKSTDGTNFTLIRTVRGRGTYSNVSDYSVTDQTPANGINYYRLKQYDFDGKVKDHGVRTVTFNGSSYNLRAYPNPVVNNVFTLESSENNMGLSYTITDISGRRLTAGRINQERQSVDITSLPKGIFILQLTNGKNIKLLKK